MKSPKSVPVGARMLVAVFVACGLAAIISIAAQASRQATATKLSEFDASREIQLAAREHMETTVAAARN